MKWNLLQNESSIKIELEWTWEGFIPWRFLNFILKILSFDEKRRSFLWKEFLRLFEHLQAYFLKFKTLQQLHFQQPLFHHNFFLTPFSPKRTVPKINVWDRFRDETPRPILSNSSLFMLFEIETAAKDWFLACKSKDIMTWTPFRVIFN